MSKTNFAVLLLGAAIGAGTAYLYLRKHFEQIAQEEIDSVKETYSCKCDGRCKCEPEESEEENEKTEYEAATNEYKSAEPNAVKIHRTGVRSEPYVIKPDEFGMLEDKGYDEVSLTYYSDGVLVDDGDNVIEDTASLVGTDFADYFGEYEEDSVHVRNEMLKCDYEILKDNRAYINE